MVSLHNPHESDGEELDERSGLFDRFSSVGRFLGIVIKLISLFVTLVVYVPYVTAMALLMIIFGVLLFLSSLADDLVFRPILGQKESYLTKLSATLEAHLEWAGSRMFGGLGS